MAGAGAGALRALNSGGDGPGGRLLLQGDSVSGVGILERSLKDLGLVPTRPGEWLTPELGTDLVTMVGFTWQASTKVPRIHVRLHRSGSWSLWQPVALLHDLPDPGEEAGGRLGTAPMLVDPIDGIQVRVAGKLPRDVRLTLIHAAQQPGDQRLATARRAATVSKTTGVAAPGIYSRADWGANENWRSGAPRYNSTIVQAHIHHTATSNGYAPADVPALIRSMYKYHTKSLGWSDIGYNFLVDIYGAIWEGRYGGPDQAVRGAHTLGFNNSSTGFSVIGNYDTAAPSAATLAALSSLAAWKLSMYGRDPNGTTAVTSEGSDKYPKGRTVTLPVIDGHRDTNDTACPGSNLYAQLPSIRAGTAGAIAGATLKLKKQFVVHGETTLGQTLTVEDGKFKPKEAAVSYQWVRNDVAITGATAATYVVTESDVGTQIGVVVTGTLPNVPPLSQGVLAEGLAKSVPTLTVRTQRRPGGKAIVHVVVTAPNVAEVDGTMVIKVGPRQRTVTVKKGKAVARILGLPAGRFRVRCQYAGGTYTVAGKARDWVRIPGKGKNA